MPVCVILYLLPSSWSAWGAILCWWGPTGTKAVCFSMVTRPQSRVQVMCLHSIAIFSVSGPLRFNSLIIAAVASLLYTAHFWDRPHVPLLNYTSLKHAHFIKTPFLMSTISTLWYTSIKMTCICENHFHGFRKHMSLCYVAVTNAVPEDP